MRDPEGELAIIMSHGRVKLLRGDCLDIMPTLEADSLDACVTDPPYHLTSIVKRFGKPGSAPAQDGVYKRASRGFMGKQWDGGDIAFQSDLWREILRILKPGAHLLAFGGTRTYHRMACAIEDAGFEIRDQIQWLYGSGFPKSHDVSKGIDRAAGKQIGIKRISPTRSENGTFNDDNYEWKWDVPVTAPATPESAQWSGWGTALKPACEPIVLARKPLSEGTIAANVLKWGTGALNIDGCRVGTEDKTARPAGIIRTRSGADGAYGQRHGDYRPIVTESGGNASGRWPANVIHDGSEEVVAGFPDVHSAGSICESKWPRSENVNVYGKANEGMTGARYGDSGSAARFFYSAKADSTDRLGSKHPTVKPVDLMAYLCRLITPPGGTVLDPFAGSGSTGMACLREGFNCILIEREPEYIADIENRIAHVSGLDTPLFTAAVDKYDPVKDVEGSFNEAYRTIRERKAAGGPGWEPK